MIASGVLLLGIVGALISPFRFRLDAADAARYREPGTSPAPGVAVVLRAAAANGARADLLTLASDRFPRWRWADAGFVAAGRVTLRAAAGSTALLVLSGGPDPGYRLDGPFRWPSAPSEREAVVRPARTVRGSSPPPGGANEIRLAGIDPVHHPLCESAVAEGWQCVGVPRGFSGRLVACRGDAVAGSAELRPESPAEAVLRPVAFAALLRVELSEPGSGRGSPSVRVLRHPGPRDFVTRPDPRWNVSELSAGLFWIETVSASPEAIVEVAAPSHATGRLAIPTAETRCAEPLAVALPRASSLRGSVLDPEGSPVSGALVFVRTAGEDAPSAVVGDGETDSNGEFEIGALAAASHRVRACHGEHGCTEEPAHPDLPVVLRLPGGGAFTGRVISRAGVPQAGASVRILPTAATWSTADDRLARLPLASTSGSDGRFRISAAGDGDYLVEVRSESSGVARVPVRRTNLSPRVTDLGDVPLPESIGFTARVSGCASGSLFLSGPLGGETSLPALLRFRLDPEGAGAVRLPEGGAWTAWASCPGGIDWLEPALLPDAAALAGLEVRFRGAGSRPRD